MRLFIILCSLFATTAMASENNHKHETSNNQAEVIQEEATVIYDFPKEDMDVRYIEGVLHALKLKYYKIDFEEKLFIRGVAEAEKYMDGDKPNQEKIKQLIMQSRIAMQAKTAQTQPDRQ